MSLTRDAWLNGEEDISEEDFIFRFVTEMTKLAPFKFFDAEDGPSGNAGGGSVEEYAKATAQSYWMDEDQRADGPEECARADMDCWG